MAIGSELNMNQNASALQMANAIFGDGVQVIGATYSGSYYSSATYTGGNTTSPGVVPGDSGVILSTGYVGYFTQSNGDPNRSSSTGYNSSGQDNNGDFNTIAGGVRTYDASYLTTTFIPNADVMTIQFVFSSEEYPEYSNSQYNDVVGVWSNGVHIPISVTQSAASVTEINPNENINLYRDNTGDQYNTEMDGFTVTMTLTIPVRAGQVNTLRIGIADASDSNYDSNLLIAGNSVQTTMVAIQDDVTIAPGGTRNVDVLANDINNTGGTMVVTHINGVPVVAGQTVTLPTGQQVTLMPDGTFDITTTNTEVKNSFTYATQSIGANGQVLQVDTGFVTVDTVPCFVAGTRIRTPDGEVRVEDLTPGDLVETLDDGPQPLRWTGQRTVEAAGALAPIRIAAGALGDHGDILLSPLHRVLVGDTLAALLFGEDDVLVAARDLVNDLTIRPCPGGVVTYVHLMFDRHQVIWSEGLATESFLPGPQMKKAFARDALHEIRTLFPQIDWMTGDGYSPAARRTLKRYEAQVMRRAVA